jgi:hypothetical protein
VDETEWSGFPKAGGKKKKKRAAAALAHFTLQEVPRTKVTNNPPSDDPQVLVGTYVLSDVFDSLSCKFYFSRYLDFICR